MSRFEVLRRVLLLVLVGGLAVGLGRPALGQTQEPDAFYYNRLLGRGINFGNMLEAPQEGDWGVRLEEAYFDRVKEAGFDSVRIPIRWSAHAAQTPPYQVDDRFFQRVDWAVQQALQRDLAVVINIHHYEEIYQHPAEHQQRFLTLWEQIARRYQDQPNQLFFEILNEPNRQLTSELWNQYLRDALGVIRKSNPRRPVIVGPGHWNNVNHLKELSLPDDDLLIVTFHYYLPFQFTHQGAEWVEGSRAWLGRTWTGTPEERAAVVRDFDQAAAWAREHGRPLYVGEFGAYSKAPLESRVEWTEFVRKQAEDRGFSWAYWEFASGFGIYDPRSGQWRAPLRDALVGG